MTTNVLIWLLFRIYVWTIRERRRADVIGCAGGARRHPVHSCADRLRVDRPVNCWLGRRSSQSRRRRSRHAALVDAGLVVEVPAGRAKLYSLNRHHVAYPPITQLAGLKDELYRRIRDAIARWSTPPLAAAGFGSYARGTSVAHVSQIDLSLAAWAVALGRLRGRIDRERARPCQIPAWPRSRLLHLSQREPCPQVHPDSPQERAG